LLEREVADDVRIQDKERFIIGTQDLPRQCERACCPQRLGLLRNRNRDV
jgi:hypothetical protein